MVSLPRMSKVWMDGEFVDVEAASVSVMSPTLHAGWGVFEDLSARPTNRGVTIFQHRAHQVQLANSAKVLDIPLPYSVDELMQGVRDLCRRNSVRHAFKLGMIIACHDVRAGRRVAARAWQVSATNGSVLRPRP